MVASVVVGRGPAAIMAALQLAEHRVDVTLIAGAPLERATSNLSTLSMSAVPKEASHVVELLDRIGVPLDRTSEGHVRRHADDVVTAGMFLGRLVHRALEQQVRAGHLCDRIRVVEHEELLGLIREDGGACRGVVTVQTRHDGVHLHVADTVLLCDDGAEGVLGLSTSGSGRGHITVGAAKLEGMAVESLHLPREHRCCVAGADRPRVIPDAARCFGAVVVDGKMLVPRNPATQPLLAREQRLGASPPFELITAIDGLFGGLKVDGSMRTSIPRLFAAGGSAARPWKDEQPGFELAWQLCSPILATRSILDEKPGTAIDAGKTRARFDETVRNAAGQRGNTPYQVLIDELGTLMSRALTGEVGDAAERLSAWRVRIDDVDGRIGAAHIHALRASHAIALSMLDALPKPSVARTSSEARA